MCVYINNYFNEKKTHARCNCVRAWTCKTKLDKLNQTNELQKKAEVNGLFLTCEVAL